ncbi:hypothetical protein E4J71_13215 [Peribacillus frigoritolerans]|nr:hypothetical protein DOZ91_11395 [Peribacillus frigoritolerans]TFH61267.1 hypothetical protein E4J71_13215 [Peribacillus frigoritolerans]
MLYKSRIKPRLQRIILFLCKIFIYFSISREYDNQQFHISKSLKPYGAGDPLLGLFTIQGVNPFKKVGLLLGPNPTANLVSVI